MTENLSCLRKQIRAKRRKLDIYSQRKSAHHILIQLRTLAAFKHSQHVGIYLDAFGEIQTRKIILMLFQLGKKVYLPRVCAMNQTLHWIPISLHQYNSRRFYWHRLGMQEAMNQTQRSIQKIDLLIMPLLACDEYGTRIGMGGGFYDRSLAHTSKSPIRLGLAHNFQFIQHTLPRQIWDQALDILITPQKTRHFKRHKRPSFLQ